VRHLVPAGFLGLVELRQGHRGVNWHLLRRQLGGGLSPGVILIDTSQRCLPRRVGDGYVVLRVHGALPGVLAWLVEGEIAKGRRGRRGRSRIWNLFSQERIAACSSRDKRLWYWSISGCARRLVPDVVVVVVVVVFRAETVVPWP
jgi:hypothetical protein